MSVQQGADLEISFARAGANAKLLRDSSIFMAFVGESVYERASHSDDRRYPRFPLPEA
jgi:hypothetical protein